MKGPKRHPWIKRAQRRARVRKFVDIVERGPQDAFLREMRWRVRHLEYADMKHLINPPEQP